VARRLSWHLLLLRYASKVCQACDLANSETDDGLVWCLTRISLRVFTLVQSFGTYRTLKCQLQYVFCGLFPVLRAADRYVYA
jgi:hypothetical protein